MAVCADIVNQKKSDTKKDVIAEEPSFNIFRSVQAWNISLFMGLQSFTYCCLVAFLPTILYHYGVDQAEAAWTFSVLQLAMLPTMLIAPIITTRIKNIRPLIYLIGISYVGGLMLLMLLKGEYKYISAVLIGVSAGFAFSLSIMYITIRSRSIKDAIKVSGKAQSIGYLIAAVGPVIFGKIHEYDYSWDTSLQLLFGAIALMIFFALRAAKPMF